MRSSTTFFIFLGMVVLVLLIGTVSMRSTANDPVVRAAEAFLAAIANNDLAAVERATDARNVKIISAGARVVSIKFGAIAPGGAFMKRDEVSWSYADLAQMARDTTIPPVEAKGMATVACGAFKLYLRQADGAWKVFYIEKPKAQTP
ncbi:MAG TPA: hypothetical protein PLZ36_10360 [Armatimonadota bacterium]|nr:hypothetical protein [Armatimonadota bacterium]